MAVLSVWHIDFDLPAIRYLGNLLCELRMEQDDLMGWTWPQGVTLARWLNAKRWVGVQKLSGLQRVVRRTTQELLRVFFDFCEELLQVEGHALDFTGLSKEAHDMVVPEQELIANTVLSKRDVGRGDGVVEFVERQVTLPRIAQRMPRRLCAHTSNMKCAMQEDESIGFRKHLLQG